MAKSSDLPHTQRQGWLKNGNKPGDFTKAIKCGAFARTTGAPCKAPAMRNGRCRMHGGRSTGPRTLAGKERSRRGNFKHGEYSKENKEILKAMRRLLGKR